MICPHCKKENVNEYASVCAYCKGNMRPGTVSEEMAVELRKEQKRTFVFSVLKGVLLAVLAIAVIAVVALVLKSSSDNNSESTTTTQQQNQQLQGDVTTTHKNQQAQGIVTTTQAPNIEKNETTVNPTLFGEWTDITIGDKTLTLPKTAMVINGNTVKCLVPWKAF
jgi:hypothetical protein